MHFTQTASFSDKIFNSLLTCESFLFSTLIPLLHLQYCSSFQSGNLLQHIPSCEVTIFTVHTFMSVQTNAYLFTIWPLVVINSCLQLSSLTFLYSFSIHDSFLHHVLQSDYDYERHLFSSFTFIFQLVFVRSSFNLHLPSLPKRQIIIRSIIYVIKMMWQIITIIIQHYLFTLCQSLVNDISQFLSSEHIQLYDSLSS